MAIRLVEITKDNLNSVLRLKVSESQNQFVANNAVSILQGTYEENVWFRGIFLWRYMIAEQHQSKGYGKSALLQIIDMVRGLPNAKSLSLSCLPADDSPRPFYEKLGFAETGEVE